MPRENTIWVVLPAYTDPLVDTPTCQFRDIVFVGIEEQVTSDGKVTVRAVEDIDEFKLRILLCWLVRVRVNVLLANNCIEGNTDAKDEGRTVSTEVVKVSLIPPVI